MMTIFNPKKMISSRYAIANISTKNYTCSTIKPSSSSSVNLSNNSGYIYAPYIISQGITRIDKSFLVKKAHRESQLKLLLDSI